MRVSNLIVLALPAIWIAEAHSQDASDEALRELYCEICPYDAPVRPGGRNQFSPFRSTTVVTPDDMHALSIRSVADMISQLRNGKGLESEETEAQTPFYLDASMDALRRTLDELAEQSESYDESTEAPTDSNPRPNDGQAEE